MGLVWCGSVGWLVLVWFWLWFWFCCRISQKAQDHKVTLLCAAVWRADRVLCGVLCGVPWPCRAVVVGVGWAWFGVVSLLGRFGFALVVFGLVFFVLALVSVLHWFSFLDQSDVCVCGRRQGYNYQGFASLALYASPGPWRCNFDQFRKVWRVRCVVWICCVDLWNL